MAIAELTQFQVTADQREALLAEVIPLLVINRDVPVRFRADLPRARSSATAEKVGDPSADH